jgi:hypothetical protein
MLCLVAGAEAGGVKQGVLEMGCLHRGWGDFGNGKKGSGDSLIGRWARAAVACIVGLAW